jgi:hypothetical protein
MDAFLRPPLSRKLIAIGAALAGVAIAPLLARGGGSSLLFGALGLAAAAFAVLGRLRATESEPAPLKVLGRAALGPRSGLALVEADGQRLLVAYGDGFAQTTPLRREESP